MSLPDPCEVRHTGKGNSAETNVAKSHSERKAPGVSPMKRFIAIVMVVVVVHASPSTETPSSTPLPPGVGTDFISHAATGTPALAPTPFGTSIESQTAEPANTDGYMFMAGVGATRLGRVVRMDPTTPAAVRNIMRDAVDQINASSGAQLVVGPDTSAPPGVDEIVVRVPEVTVCGPLAAGCASNGIGSSEGVGVVTNALIEIKRDLLGSGYEIPILLHEMGHAMGLGHYDVPYRTQMQVMWNSVTPDMVAYRAGDRQGLAALGAAFANPNVTGNIDSVRMTPQGIRVIGWTLDLDDPAPALPVSTTVDSALAASGIADLYRPDVGAVFAGAGNLHGFDMLVPTPANDGVVNICVDAVGNRSQQVRVACRNLAVSHQPTGNLEVARQSGPNRVRVSGWALDPDTADPIGVHIYVNGRYIQGDVANRRRPDVEAIYPGYGPDHGFGTDLVGVPGGTNRVCAFGIDSQGGTNALLGCRQVTVASGNPVGYLEGPVPTWLLPTVMTGWALDPDTADAINVHLYVDGRWGGSARADMQRRDVAAAYPGYGDAHGFAIALPGLRAGTYRGCVYAINVGPGSTNTLIGCRTFTIPGGVPFGNLDAVRIIDGRMSAVGWTIDPDVATPISVHLYADGRFVTSALANRPRPDVAAAFVGYGDPHGFVIPLDGVASGLRTICIYAINVATGTYNPLLGCRQAAIT